jgi:hypothetical protein
LVIHARNAGRRGGVPPLDSTSLTTGLTRRDLFFSLRDSFFSFLDNPSMIQQYIRPH